MDIKFPERSLDLINVVTLMKKIKWEIGKIIKLPVSYLIPFYIKISHIN